MSVVFSSWASESGSWITGDAVTTPGADVRRADHFNIYDDTTAQGRTAGDEDPDGRDGVSTIVERPLHRRPLVQLEGQDLLQRHDPDGHDADAVRTLPNQVIWTVQYNTNHYGPNPTGASSPADWLNVGIKTFDAAAFVGTDLNEDLVVVDSTYAPRHRLDQIPPARRDHDQVDD